MSTTTTIVDFKTQLLARLTTALATAGEDGGPVQCRYAWPGPNTQPNTVFFGRWPDAGAILPSIRIDSAVPTIKAGRKQRQESYTVEVSIFTAGPDLSADSESAAIADNRAFTIHAALDSLLAEDPKIGLGLASIQWARIASTEILAGGPFPYEKGYSVLLLVSIDVEARLT